MMRSSCAAESASQNAPAAWTANEAAKNAADATILFMILIDFAFAVFYFM
jgi:hypothetical protein